MDHGKRAMALWLSVTVSVAAYPEFSQAQSDESVGCSRAIVSVRNQVTRSDTRRLSRCALAILDGKSSAAAGAWCDPLRQPGRGVSVTDARSRKRIAHRCDHGWPAWLSTYCGGPGPVTGLIVDDGETLARCVVESAHCLAALAADSLFPGLAALLQEQGVGAGADSIPAAFSGCLAPPTTTTTSAATTTSLPSATTTLPAVTTTLVTPTTTLFVPTTTLSIPTTTTVTVSTTLPDTETTTTTFETAVTTTVVPETTTLPATPPTDLVISEIMHNPAAQSDSLGEYIELYNAGVGAVDLAGLVVRDDGADAFVIDASVIVPSGAYAVLGKSASAAPGAVDYVFGTGMTLSNSDDEVVLVLDGLVVDRAVYDARFPLAAGKSLELRTAALDASANDDPGAWCVASSGMGNGDFGSPRTVSSCSP